MFRTSGAKTSRLLLSKTAKIFCEKNHGSLLSEVRSIKAIVLVMLAPRPVVPLDRPVGTRSQDPAILR